MSGPKGYSVYVESPEEKLRRETNQTQARCRLLKDRAEQLRREVGVNMPAWAAPRGQTLPELQAWEQRLGKVVSELEGKLKLMNQTEANCLVLSDQLEGLRSIVGAGVQPCAGPQRHTLDQLQAWEQRLKQRIAKAEGILAQRRSAMRAQIAASSVASQELRGVSLGDLRAEGSTRRQVPQVETQTSEVLHKKAVALLGRAGEIGDPALQARFVRSMKQMLTLKGAMQQRAWMALQSAVADAVTNFHRMQHTQAVAQKEVLRIAHLKGPQADAIRAAAKNVVDDAGLASLHSSIDQAVAQAERKADAAFVTEQARLALMDLGYVVDEPFQMLEDVGFIARRPDLANHGLKVQVSAEGKMLTQVIAVEGTTPSDDIAAEQSTCADVFSFTRAMQDRGVYTQLGPHMQPGQVPMEHSLPGVVKAKQQTKAKSKRVSPKAMGLRP